MSWIFGAHCKIVDTYIMDGKPIIFDSDSGIRLHLITQVARWQLLLVYDTSMIYYPPRVDPGRDFSGLGDHPRSRSSRVAALALG